MATMVIMVPMKPIAQLVTNGSPFVLLADGSISISIRAVVTDASSAILTVGSDRQWITIIAYLNEWITIVANRSHGTIND